MSLDVFGNVFQADGEGFQPAGEPGLEFGDVALGLGAQFVDLGAQIVEFVGDQQAGHDQQARVPDLADAVGEFLDATPDLLRQRQEVLLLSVVARSEEHTSELQSLMRTSYAVFCLKKNKNPTDKYYYTVI